MKVETSKTEAMQRKKFVTAGEEKLQWWEWPQLILVQVNLNNHFHISPMGFPCVFNLAQTNHMDQNMCQYVSIPSHIFIYQGHI